MDKSRLVKAGLGILKETTLVAVAAIAVIGALRLGRYFQTSSAPSGTTGGRRAPLTVDSQLTLRSAEFTKHRLSMILITSPTCPYCLASKSFHQTLESDAKANHVPFFVAVPSLQNAATYLHDAKFSRESLREWHDLSLAVSATPTLVAVDEKGTVKRLWVGQLPPDRELSVLRVIKAKSLSEPDSLSSDTFQVPNYSSRDLSGLKAHGKISIVDTHERDFPRIREDAVVMPIEELFVRAPNELDKKKLQLVDCSSLIALQCQRSVETLKKAGFRVATLDAGTYEEYCRAAAVQ